MSSTELSPIDQIEAFCLTQPQVGCVVTHWFGPGIYIRTVTIPAGVFVTSKVHKLPHTNQMLAGRIMMSENGSRFHEVAAPHRYESGPGQKMGEAITEVVWQNIFATSITDVELLEKQLFETSPAFDECANKVHELAVNSRRADTQDFFMVLDECGISPYQASAESERTNDLIPMPAGYHTMIRRSAIEGQGVFSQIPVRPGEAIGPARVAGKRTPLGRFANHSRKPNAKFVEVGGDAVLMATAHINPYCNELVPGDEVTVDYRQALSLSGRLK